MKSIRRPRRAPSELTGQEPRGDGQQDAGTVCGLLVGGDGAAMADPGKRAEGQIDDPAIGPPGRVRDEADAAGVAFGGPIRPGPGTGRRPPVRSRHVPLRRSQEGSP
jgi:hypothetical protein